MKRNHAEYTSIEDAALQPTKRIHLEPVETKLPPELVLEILSFHQVTIDFNIDEETVPLFSILYGFFLSDQQRQITQIYHHLALRESKQFHHRHDFDTRKTFLINIQQQVSMINHLVQSLDISSDEHFIFAGVKTLNPNLTRLWLQGVDISTNDLEWIFTNCTKLRTLSIDADMSLSNQSLQNLKNLTRLKVLELGAHGKTNKLDPSLFELESLKELSLPFTRVGSDFLQGIYANKSLKKLELKCITGACNAATNIWSTTLQENKSLEKLRIWENAMNGGAANVYANCALKHIVVSCKSKQKDVIQTLLNNTVLSAHLTSLTLDIGKITVDAAELLYKYTPNLKTLSLLNINIVNKAFELLATHPKIANLLIHGSIADYGCKIITQNKNLESLVLRNFQVAPTKITDDGIQNIPNLPKLYELSVDGTDVTDEGIRHIATCPSLRYLNITNTLFTAEGLIKTFQNNTTIETIVHGKFTRGKDKLSQLSHIQLLESEE